MKVDMSEVHSALGKLKSAQKTFSSQIEKSINGAEAVAGSSAMKGITKQNIAMEIGNYKIPLLARYSDIADDMVEAFNKAIHGFESIVKEGDHSAVIHSETLDNLKADVSKSKSKIENLNDEMNAAYADVKGLAGLETLSSSEITSKLDQSKKILTETKQWMSEFNGKEYYNGILSDIHKQTQTAGRIKGAIGAGYNNAKTLKTIYDNKFLQDSLNKSKTLENNYLKKIPQLKFLKGKLSTKDFNNLAYAIASLESIQSNFKTYNGPVTLGLKEIQDKFKVVQDFYKTLWSKGKGGKEVIRVLEVGWKNLSKDKTFNALIHKGYLSNSLERTIKHWTDLPAKYLKKFDDIKLVSEISKFKTPKFLKEGLGLLMDPKGKSISYIKKGIKALGDNKNVLRKVDAELADYRKLILSKTELGRWTKIGKKLKLNWLKGERKVLKFAGKFGKVAGPVATISLVAVDVGQNYFDKSNKNTYHNVGHSVVHSAVSGVKNAGVIDGATSGAALGATMFGFPGAVAGASIGALAGGANQLWGKLDKKGKDGFYAKAEKFGDNAVDNAGKAINKGVNNVKSWFGKTFSGKVA